MKPVYYILFLLILFTSCLGGEDFHVRSTEVINITEYSVPDSVTVSDTLQISATAEEYSDCWGEFQFVFGKANDTVYSLTAYGVFETYGGCDDDTISKDTVINLIPTKKGTYLFYIARDRYSSDVDTVIVSE